MGNTRLTAQREGAPNDIAAADVLRRVGEELSSSAATLQSLQASFTPVIAGSVALRPDLMRDLQHLDKVEQVLRNLSSLIADWTAAHPGPLDALIDRLSLAELAARLRGAASATAAAGEFDLF